MKNYLFLLTIAIFISACQKADDSGTFTLYSNAPTDVGFREHIATFDAIPQKDLGGATQKQFDKWYEEDNLKNCNKTAASFQLEWDRSTADLKDPKIKIVKWWCEKGRYKK